MEVSVALRMNGTRDAVWSIVSNVEAWPGLIRGVKGIEVINDPTAGMLGLRWKETRLLFDKPETVEKWVIASVEQQFFTSQAEQDGFVFTSTMRLEEHGESVLLTSIHRTEARTWMARLRSLPLFLFKRTIKKIILDDLQDIEIALEAVP